MDQSKTFLAKNIRMVVFISKLQQIHIEYLTINWCDLAQVGMKLKLGRKQEWI